MTNPFQLPAKFELRLSAHHPMIYDNVDLDDPEDTGRPDMSRMQFRVRLVCDGKHVAMDSPAFSAVETEVFTAYRVLRELLADIITHAVLPDDRCPAFQVKDGVIQFADTQPALSPEPLNLNTES